MSSSPSSHAAPSRPVRGPGSSNHHHNQDKMSAPSASSSSPTPSTRVAFRGAVNRRRASVHSIATVETLHTDVRRERAPKHKAMQKLWSNVKHHVMMTPRRGKGSGGEDGMAGTFPRRASIHNATQIILRDRSATETSIAAALANVRVSGMDARRLAAERDRIENARLEATRALERQALAHQDKFVYASALLSDISGGVAELRRCVAALREAEADLAAARAVPSLASSSLEAGGEAQNGGDADVTARNHHHPSSSSVPVPPFDPDAAAVAERRLGACAGASAEAADVAATTLADPRAAPAEISSALRVLVRARGEAEARRALLSRRSDALRASTAAAAVALFVAGAGPAGGAAQLSHVVLRDIAETVEACERLANEAAHLVPSRQGRVGAWAGDALRWCLEEARRFVAVLHGRALAALEAQAASTQEGEQGEGGRPGAGGDARPDREEGACSLREVAEAVVVVAAQWEGAGRRLGVRLLPHIESDLAALIKAAAAARIDALGCGIARQAEEELRRGLAAADAEADAPADVLSASAGGLGAALRSIASDLGPLMDDEMRCHAGAAMAEALRTRVIGALRRAATDGATGFGGGTDPEHHAARHAVRQATMRSVHRMSAASFAFGGKPNVSAEGGARLGGRAAGISKPLAQHVGYLRKQVDADVAAFGWEFRDMIGGASPQKGSSAA